MNTKKVRTVCKTEARKAVKGHEKKMHKMREGGGIKIRGTGAATKGTRATGPMA